MTSEFWGFMSHKWDGWGGQTGSRQPWRLCLVDNLSQKVEASATHTGQGGSLGPPNPLSKEPSLSGWVRSFVFLDQTHMFDIFSFLFTFMVLSEVHLMLPMRLTDRDLCPHWSAHKLKLTGDDSSGISQGSGLQAEPLLADVTAPLGYTSPLLLILLPQLLTHSQRNCVQPTN